MQVILLEDVDKLGGIGEIVAVKRGFANNFLLPRGMAMVASMKNVRQLEHQKKVAGFSLAKARLGAQQMSDQVTQLSLTISRKVGEQDKLFGSVTKQDIHALLVEQGVDIDKRKLLLDEPIKALGEFVIPVRIMQDMTVNLKLTVAAE